MRLACRQIAKWNLFLFSVSCNKRIVWKLEGRVRQKTCKGTVFRRERLVFPFCFSPKLLCEYAMSGSLCVSLFALLQIRGAHIFTISWDAQMWIKKSGEVIEGLQNTMHGKMIAVPTIIVMLRINYGQVGGHTWVGKTWYKRGVLESKQSQSLICWNWEHSVRSSKNQHLFYSGWL